MRQYTFKNVPSELQPQTEIAIGQLIWEQIAQFPDYEISTHGTVRRCLDSSPAKHAGQIISPSLHRGYARVSLQPPSGGRRIPVRVHQILAKAFLPEKKAGEVIRHLDGRSELPTIWTLGIGSEAENRVDHEMHQYFVTMLNPTPQMVERGAILLDITIGELSIEAIAAKWKVKPDTVKDLKNGSRHRMELAFVRDILSTWDQAK